MACIPPCQNRLSCSRTPSNEVAFGQLQRPAVPGWGRRLAISNPKFLFDLRDKAKLELGGYYVTARVQTPCSCDDFPENPPEMPQAKLEPGSFYLDRQVDKLIFTSKQ